METIAIISIIGSLGTLIAVFSKSIKKSECCGCSIISRTPPASVNNQPNIIISQPPTPIPTPNTSPQNNRKVLNEYSV